MSGYNVRVTRDVAGDILTADILTYIDGFQSQASAEGEEIVLVLSGFVQNPKTAITGSQVDIVNDDDQDTNDVLFGTMESSTRTFQETQMGVDDNSNLVASERDIIKLLNTHIFQFRLEQPNEFVSDGLLAHVTTTSFVTSDPLDTANKIRNFYREVMRLLHDDVIDARQTFIDNRV